MPGCKQGDLAQIRGCDLKEANGHFVTCEREATGTSGIDLRGRSQSFTKAWIVSGSYVEYLRKAHPYSEGRPIALFDSVLFPIRPDQPGKEDHEVRNLRTTRLSAISIGERLSQYLNQETQP